MCCDLSRVLDEEHPSDVIDFQINPENNKRKRKRKLGFDSKEYPNPLYAGVFSSSS